MPVGTYTWRDIFEAASESLEHTISVDRGAIACSMALDRVWLEADWRESLGEIPPFFLIPYVQDYGSPSITVPSDFLGLRQAYYINIQSSANGKPYEKELTCIGKVSDTYLPGVDQNPTVMGYYEPTASFRIHPNPQIGAPYGMISKILYKRKPYSVLRSSGVLNTPIYRITPQVMSDALIPFGDNYVSCWIMGVQWAIAVITGRNMQKALELFMNEVNVMAQTEAMELGNPVMKPESNLTSNVFGNTWW